MNPLLPSFFSRANRSTIRFMAAENASTAHGPQAESVRAGCDSGQQSDAVKPLWPRHGDQIQDLHDAPGSRHILGAGDHDPNARSVQMLGAFQAIVSAENGAEAHTNVGPAEQDHGAREFARPI